MDKLRLLGAGLAAAAFVALAGCSREEAAPEPVRAVRTLTVGADTAGGTREYAAEIRARTESRLAFRVPGQMIARPAEVGMRVAPGTVLARLDPQDLRLAQAAARAGTQAAQVNLELAEADFRRYRELRDQGFISAADLERRETVLKAARAQFEQARASAGVQVNQASYAVLTATERGVVTAVEADPGAVLAAGTPVVRLAPDGPRDAVFAVPEDAVAPMRALLGRPGALQLRPWGSDAGSSVAGVAATLLPATVREIAASADPVTRTFQVKADIGRTELRIGQTATVVLTLPRQPGVVKLPLSALTQVQGASAVWLVDAATMTVRPQPVAVAGADGNEVVVASGLRPGQVVVTAGVHVLSPGQKVKLYRPAADGANAQAAANAARPTAASAATAQPAASAAR